MRRDKLRRRLGTIRLPAGLASLLLLLAAAPLPAQTRDRYEPLRKLMVKDFVAAAGVKSEKVIEVMGITPRHEFVPAIERSKAYYDMSLPIGEQQTISSPFIVAYMTESIDPQPDDKVLEIGTGSGYQAAVLSPLVKEVYTIEIVEELGKRAAETLDRLGYDNVHAKVGDGFLGWPEHAPFDKIIVTCSPERVPRPLVEQLREGGLMVIPVGERYQQTLYLMRKKDGELAAEKLRPTLFVPMTGRAEEARRVQPDPARPALVNGDFEEDPGEGDFVPGWYYERQAEVVEDRLAPGGSHYARFENDVPGRPAHLLQGFPIDGRSVSEISVSAWVKLKNVRPGLSRSELPVVAVLFFDDNRKDLGAAYIGPFRGSADWHEVSRVLRVPAGAREAIFRVGMFGATGEASFDKVRMEKAE